ncbi:hypothetical protein [Vibrio phage LP.1]|nr:hypothetical protein [Vibrio phage LP.1]
MGCTNGQRHVGRITTLEVAFACPNEDPAGATFVPVGAVTTKSMSIDGNVLEANDSAASSGFSENQLSTSQLSISLSGNCLKTDGTASVIGQIERLRFNAVKQDLSEDPIILVRYARPINTLTAYMIINSISNEDPDSEYSTWSMELSLAPAPLYPPSLVPTVV